MYPIPRKSDSMIASMKSSYKITIWKDYNESLIRRGDITFWFDLEEMLCRDEELHERESTRTSDILCDIRSVDLTQRTHHADLCGASRH